MLIILQSTERLSNKDGSMRIAWIFLARRNRIDFMNEIRSCENGNMRGQIGEMRVIYLVGVLGEMEPECNRNSQEYMRVTLRMMPVMQNTEPELAILCNRNQGF